jgi:hypothetical protein
VDQPEINEHPPLGAWYTLYAAGFPTCHEHCARNYFIVMYDIFPNGETQYTLSLN